MQPSLEEISGIHWGLKTSLIWVVLRVLTWFLGYETPERPRDKNGPLLAIRDQNLSDATLINAYELLEGHAFDGYLLRCFINLMTSGGKNCVGGHTWRRRMTWRCLRDCLQAWRLRPGLTWPWHIRTCRFDSLGPYFESQAGLVSSHICGVNFGGWHTIKY